MIPKDSSNAGRPPKGKAKRSYKITVSFNEDEIRMMRHKALTEEDRKLLRSLGNIGNNLNQLVHNLHAFGRTAQERELRQIAGEFSQLLAYFREVRNGG